MAFGDHLCANRFRGVYTHHGIDCGDGWVIHYNGVTPLHCVVKRATWEEFSGGDPVQVREYGLDASRGEAAASSWALFGNPGVQRLFDACTGRLLGEDLDMGPDAVVTRAESRLGEGGFDFLFNNCEHFATWCKTGRSNSQQVESLWSALVEPHRSFLPGLVARTFA